MTTEYTIPMDPIREILFRDHRFDNLRGKITKITTLQQIWPNYNPRDPITERQMMIGVYNHLRNASYLGSITILRR